MNKDFYDKPIYTASNFIISAVQTSLYFLLCNFPIIIYLILSVFNPNIFNLLIVFITLLPLGPSLGALYYVTCKSLREKDMFFSSKYFYIYKKYFKSNLKVWSFLLLGFALLFIDFQYFFLHKTSSGIHIIFVVLMVILSIISLYAIPINSHFTIKFKDLVLTSVFCMFKKFPITLFKCGVIFLIYYFSHIIPLVVLFFLPIIICFAFSYYDNIVLKELEERSVTS